MSFFPEVALDTAQAEAIARGLFAVANSDGLHEREAALVASFWADVGGSPAALAELGRRAAVTGEELAAALPTEPMRLLFLKTSLLLAWADGKVTNEERTVVDAFAKALGLASRVADLEGSVKEFLLSHLSHLSNTTATAEVAKKLQL
jgi:tellurite resistance protein